MNVNWARKGRASGRQTVGTTERRNDGRSERRDRTAVPPYRRTHVPSSRRSAVPTFRRPAVPPGFTLIEILVVITVIAILAGLVSPMVFRNVGDAKVTAAKAQIETFGLALDTYYLHNDHYPSTAQGLNALVRLPSGEPAARNWRGPYMKKGVPLDPWGTPYRYESPGPVNPTSYDLLSYGRDGKLGGEGEDADLTSWDGGTAVRRKAGISGTAVRRNGGTIEGSNLALSSELSLVPSSRRSIVPSSRRSTVPTSRRSDVPSYRRSVAQ